MEVMWTTVQAFILEVSKISAELLAFLRLLGSGFTILQGSQINLCTEQQSHTLEENDTTGMLPNLVGLQALKIHNRCDGKRRNGFAKACWLLHQKFIKINVCASCDTIMPQSNKCSEKLFCWKMLSQWWKPQTDSHTTIFSRIIFQAKWLFVIIWMKRDNEKSFSYVHIHMSALLIAEFWKIQLSNETTFY